MRKPSRSSAFCECIVEILSAEGPKHTSELYPRIEAAHPDLCDDDVRDFSGGIDRGPAWKHEVRAAQERLKGRAIIYRNDDGRWQITASQVQTKL